jgi:hypothetical protein
MINRGVSHVFQDLQPAGGTWLRAWQTPREEHISALKPAEYLMLQDFDVPGLG